MKVENSKHPAKAMYETIKTVKNKWKNRYAVFYFKESL